MTGFSTQSYYLTVEYNENSYDYRRENIFENNQKKNRRHENHYTEGFKIKKMSERIKIMTQGK